MTKYWVVVHCYAATNQSPTKFCPNKPAKFNYPPTLALSNKNDSKVLVGLCDFVCLLMRVFYSVCMIVDVTVCTHVLQWPCDFVCWQVNVFYSGCVILEVRDYRRSITGSYDTQYVLLKPTSQVSLHNTQCRLLFGLWYKLFLYIYRILDLGTSSCLTLTKTRTLQGVWYIICDKLSIYCLAPSLLHSLCFVMYTLQVSFYLSPCSLCCLICTTSSMTGAIDGHRRTSLLWRVSCYWQRLNPSVWTPPRQSCLLTTNCSMNRKCCVIPSSKGQNQILYKAHGLYVIKRPLL